MDDRIKIGQLEKPENGDHGRRKGDRLQEMILSQTPRIIFRAVSAKIPFSPIDELIIDEVKATVRNKGFMTPSNTRTVKLSDVSSISLVSGPLFASLGFSEKGFSQEVIAVKRMWRDQGIRARRILEGMTILASQNTDFSKLTVDEIVTRAQKAGAVVEVV